ncbi:MAG: PEP-CTERM sorting domain-containing protein, partial [Candidatus Spyradosoma sp.]
PFVYAAWKAFPPRSGKPRIMPSQFNIQSEMLMEKFVTITTLFAAGTALANAATVRTTFENNASSTNQTYSTAVSVTNTWSDGTVAENVVSTLIYGASKSNLMYDEGATGDFVAPWAGIENSPWTLTVNYDNSSTDAGHSLSVIDQIVLDVGAFGNSFAWLTSETSLNENASISFTATVRNTSDSSSLGTLSGTWNLNGTPDFSSYKLTLTTADASAIDVSSVDSFSVALVTSCSNYPNASATYGVGLRSIVIPEPSAFGLLAGLGALALAGTRRRRRK